jgi:hypothetical protein
VSARASARTGKYHADRNAWEAAYLRAALERNGGNVKATAAELELSRPFLYDLMRAHGIAGPRGRTRAPTDKPALPRVIGGFILPKLVAVKPKAPPRAPWNAGVKTGPRPETWYSYTRGRRLRAAAG